jgi:hypothetical protein
MIEKCVHCGCYLRSHGVADVCPGGLTRFSNDPAQAEIRKRIRKNMSRNHEAVVIPIYLMTNEVFNRKEVP